VHIDTQAATFIMSRICLLLATSYAMFGLKAVRKRMFKNQEKEAGEVPAGGDERLPICTLVEDPRSAVKFGIFMQFPVKNCLIECKANSIITETVIDKKSNSANPKHPQTSPFIQARANKKNAGCACYSVTAPDEEEFLFGFTPRAQCDAEACWKEYLDVSRHVITSVQRKNQLKMDADDYLDSANHYSTKKEEGDELSADCQTSDKSDYRMIFPTFVNMKNTLLKLGDTTGLDPTEAAKVRKGAATDLKMLESTINIEDPEELDEEESANLVAETQSQPDDSMPTPTDDDTLKKLIAAKEVADEVVKPDQSKGNFSDSMPTLLTDDDTEEEVADKMEKIQQLAKIVEATEEKEIPKAMVEYHGGESNVAKCDAEADAEKRANCICSLANDLLPRVKDMQAACNEYSVNKMDWAEHWSCSIKKKKKTGSAKKEKSCGASYTLYASGGYGGASKRHSAAGPVIMKFGA